MENILPPSPLPLKNPYYEPVKFQNPQKQTNNLKFTEILLYAALLNFLRVLIIENNK